MEFQITDKEFLSAFEYAAIGMALVANDGTFLKVNQSLCRLTEYSAEELTELRFHDITHPDDLDKDLENIKKLLSGEVESYQMEKRYITKSNRHVWILLNVSYTHDKNNKFKYFIAQIQDISKTKQYERKLIKAALTDDLTQAPNRRALIYELEKRMQKSNSCPFYLVLLDIENFRNINANYGNQVGDKHIILLTNMLHQIKAESDFIAKIDSNTFAYLIEKKDYPSKVQIKKIIGYLNKNPHQLDKEHSISFNVNIGISEYINKKKTLTSLLNEASIALHHCKKTPNQSITYFRKNLDKAEKEKQFILKITEEAIKNDNIHLYFQKKVNLRSKKTTGIEILSRIPNNRNHTIEKIIHTSEQSNFIIQVDKNILLKSFAYIEKIQDKLPANFTISINLSGKTILSPKIANFIKDCIKKYNLDPTRLFFEITETTLIQNFDECEETIKKIKDLGIRFALDDFGTGYSSLSYLSRLNFDELKIDKSFIQEIDNNIENTTLVRAIIYIANNFGLQVIAEGVDNNEVLDTLKLLGCEQAQGFYFSVPQPIEELLSSL